MARKAEALVEASRFKFVQTIIPGDGVGPIEIEFLHRNR